MGLNHDIEVVVYDEEAGAYFCEDDQGKYWTKDQDSIIYHNIIGPAVVWNNGEVVFCLDDDKCDTVQEWGKVLVEKEYKTPDEAILLVLKWSKK
jgi:hypothetical protein